MTVNENANFDSLRLLSIAGVRPVFAFIQIFEFILSVFLALFSYFLVSFFGGFFVFKKDLLLSLLCVANCLFLNVKRKVLGFGV